MRVNTLYTSLELGFLYNFPPLVFCPTLKLTLFLPLIQESSLLNHQLGSWQTHCQWLRMGRLHQLEVGLEWSPAAPREQRVLRLTHCASRLQQHKQLFHCGSSAETNEIWSRYFKIKEADWCIQQVEDWFAETLSTFRSKRSTSSYLWMLNVYWKWEPAESWDSEFWNSTDEETSLSFFSWIGPLNLCFIFRHCFFWSHNGLFASVE